MIVVIKILIFIVIALLLYTLFKNVFFKNRQNSHILENSTISQEQWDEAYSALPLLKGLTGKENKSLKELSILFIHDKTFEGAQGFEISLNVLLVISLQACLPILKLGLDCYKNFSTIIVYPAGFRTNRKVTDANGIVDYDRDPMLGEAWLSGPIILSWSDSKKSGQIDGSNLVIHEFAHKLDMQNGAANGFPPLHRNMKRKDWVHVFSKAFEHFERKCTGHDFHGIDCYAATSPAEFFSVFSEVFFERPDKIKKYFPEVYDLLELYYRQTPISRLN